MKPGTSMRAGHASVQGLSKQNRHRDASTAASMLAISGLIWVKLSFHCDEPLLDTGSGKDIVLLESNTGALVPPAPESQIRQGQGKKLRTARRESLPRGARAT